MLKNNSTEMGTIVETFIIEETASLIYDNEDLDKWNKYVEELGLVGQKKISTKEKSPIPFMHLKTGLKNVFETLCPRKVDFTEYNVTPIPLEILDLIALSKKEEYFNKGIQIWYDEVTPDPVCVGIIGEIIPVSKPYTWHHEAKFKTRVEALSWLKENNLEAYNSDGGYFSNESYYLLGKWADVKRSFAELTQMATKRFVQEKGNEYEKTLKETQRKLDDLKTEAFDRFGTDVNSNDSLLF